MDQRQVVRLLAAARVAVGVVALVAPRRSASLLSGSRSVNPTLELVVRAFGVRDIALGVGTLRALDQDADVPTWARVSASCDATDAVAALVAARGISVPRCLVGAASATVAAACGFRASTRLG